MVILGISIGTRTSGIAVVRKGKLIAWDVISFRDEWTESKAEKITSRFESILTLHSVKYVVLKIPRPSHHSEAIVELLEKVKALFEYHGCMVEHKTQAEIKRTLPQISNKKDLMVFITNLYPSLSPERSQEMTNKHSYHNKMFEAVLVAHIRKDKIDI
jgi:RNase H-fold protein (predicted Holliday junction resolvase)